MGRNTTEFESAVRDYLAGHLEWDYVHKLALEMEGTNEVQFPPEISRPLEELQLIFLAADSRDEPQFRADRQDIADLLAEIDSLKNDVQRYGLRVVLEREQTLEATQERNRYLAYLEKRKKKSRR
jgi:hypothetical protein